MIGPNEIEKMAKEKPDECFLKGSGVLRLTGAIRELERQNAELRKDAERYRQLRNKSALQFEHPIVVSQHHEVGEGMRYMGPVIDRELDRLVDYAIAADQKGKAS